MAQTDPIQQTPSANTHVPGFSTRAIHTGQEPDGETGAVIPPIHVSTTFAQDGVGNLRGGYEYSRSANPTRTALETAFASLEGGARAFSFASGLAAEDTLLRAVLKPGDHVLVPLDAYGGTYRLINTVFGKWGVTHTPVDTSNPEAVAAQVQPGKTQLIIVETPSNPLLNISDIAALSAVAKTHGLLLVVDNTFATPYLQQPLSLGADVVVHSTTKYIGGHSDSVGGMVVVDDAELAEQIGFLQNAAGPVSSPWDAWVTLRGLKTLSVRMDRHSSNAQQVAQWLSEHPRVEQVRYPGLSNHPGHDIAQRQMKDFGGMVSFTVANEDIALKVVSQTSVFTLAESLGGVESLIEHPARMTHASVSGSQLEVPDTLIRLSVGIEDIEDIIADLDQAL